MPHDHRDILEDEIVLVPPETDDFFTDLIGPFDVVVADCPQIPRFRHCRSSTSTRTFNWFEFLDFKEHLRVRGETPSDSCKNFRRLSAKACSHLRETKRSIIYIVLRVCPSLA